MASFPTFSDLLRNAHSSSGELRPMAPQALNSTREGFTMALYGDEKYVASEDGEESSQPGGRHRVIIVSEGGRPRKMTLERNIKGPTDSKL